MRSPILRFAVFFFVFLLGFSVLSVATALQNHLQAAERGTICEVGRHRDLLARGGVYSQLYDEQFCAVSAAFGTQR